MASAEIVTMKSKTLSLPVTGRSAAVFPCLLRPVLTIIRTLSRPVPLLLSVIRTLLRHIALMLWPVLLLSGDKLTSLLIAGSCHCG